MTTPPRDNGTADLLAALERLQRLGHAARELRNRTDSALAQLEREVEALRAFLSDRHLSTLPAWMVKAEPAHEVTWLCPGPHILRQRRDGKPPWCKRCGRTDRGELAADLGPGRRR